MYVLLCVLLLKSLDRMQKRLLICSKKIIEMDTCRSASIPYNGPNTHNVLQETSIYLEHKTTHTDHHATHPHIRTRANFREADTDEIAVNFDINASNEELFEMIDITTDGGKVILTVLFDVATLTADLRRRQEAST